MGGEAPFVRLVGAARTFAFVVLLAPVVWSKDSPALVALLSLGGVWALAQLADARTDGWFRPQAVIEPALVGVVCGFVVDSSLAVLPALAVPTFTAGLRGGIRAVLLALVVQVPISLAVARTVVAELTEVQVFELTSWSLTGLGLGLIASFVHTALARTHDPLAPYRYAQSLIRQLIDLSGGLSSGLDPKTLGGAILSTVLDDLPAARVALYIPISDGLTPLVAKAVEPGIDETIGEEEAAQAQTLGKPVVDGRAFAFPLTTDAGTTAVVAGCLSDQVDAGRLGVADRIRRLGKRLEASAVHLDTALLFSSFRDAATAEERRRLSREMHDGIAQDIASLGYLVDAIAAREESPEQRDRIEILRERVTTIVAEVRRSVINLRTSIGENESLGMAIGAIARNLSQVAGVQIHVTLDEHPTRLRPEVEAELFRISQEAINNAVKHARASTINVHCQVHAPSATITVSDDGRGLQPRRQDSQGLEIMRERARLVGATLDITTRPHGGVAVTVRLGEPTTTPSTSPAEPTDRVSV